MLPASRALLFAATLAPLTAGAYELRKDAAGNPVSWGTSPTFTLSPSLAQTLGEPGTEAAVRAAVAAYAAQLPALGLTVQLGQNQPIGFDPAPGAHNQNEIIPIAADWPYDENAIAVTLLTVDPNTNEILDADIALNTGAHTFRALAPSSEPGGPYDDLQNTLTHELGHALGLAHNDTDTTVVMYPGAPKGEVTKRVLTNDDKAGLAVLYPPNAPTELSPRAAGCSSTQGMAPMLGTLVLMVIGLSNVRRPALDPGRGRRPSGSRGDGADRSRLTGSLVLRQHRRGSLEDHRNDPTGGDPHRLPIARDGWRDIARKGNCETSGIALHATHGGGGLSHVDPLGFPGGIETLLARRA